jgi:hypothetical protein
MAIKYNRDAVLVDLKQHTVEVKFKKVNGEDRVMRCTLLKNHLPVSEEQFETLEEEHKKPENLNTVVVWDLENNGWRSFKIDSMIYMHIVDGY